MILFTSTSKERRSIPTLVFAAIVIAIVAIIISTVVVTSNITATEVDSATHDLPTNNHDIDTTISPPNRRYAAKSSLIKKKSKISVKQEKGGGDDQTGDPTWKLRIDWTSAPPISPLAREISAAMARCNPNKGARTFQHLGGGVGQNLHTWAQ